MIIAGLDTSKPVTGTVILPRGENGEVLTLTVCALPLGFEEKVMDIFPAPTPPRKPVPSGKPTKKGAAPIFLRDPENGRLILEEDKKDPDYLAETRTQNRGGTAFILYHGLKHDTKVKFETSLDLKEKDPAQFYTQIYAELEASGLSAGDVMTILNRIMVLSNFDKKAIDRVRDDFFQSEGMAS